MLLLKPVIFFLLPAKVPILGSLMYANKRVGSPGCKTLLQLIPLWALVGLQLDRGFGAGQDSTFPSWVALGALVFWLGGSSAGKEEEMVT